jgi:uncharacterized membrane protein
MPNISFHSGFPAVPLLALAGLAVILAALFYARAYRALPPRRWAELFLLRLAAITFVLLLLFRPVASFQREVVQRRALVFLLDESASMGIADDADGGTRLEHATDKLLAWSKRLQHEFDTHILAFSDSTRQLSTPEELLELQPEGKATSLSRALDAAASVSSAQDVEAIILLSDGIHNAAGDPLEVAPQLGITVHTVGTGNSLRDRSSYRDIRVTGMDAPELLAVNNRVRMKGFVDGVGFAGRVIQVTLKEDGTAVDQQELVLDAIDGHQEVTFEFTPTTTGFHTYAVHVPAVPEEKIPENNTQSVSRHVTDARIRVLYVEGTLRAEYGALVGRFLSKDPNLEFSSLVQTRPNVFLHRSNMEDFQLDSIPEDEEIMDRFEVFLLGDLDATYWTPEQMTMMRRRVERGGGLLMMGGYHSLGPGGYQGTPLAEILPVYLGDRDVGQVTEPFQPQLTLDGRQHPIFANIVSFFASAEQEAEIAGLPPLEGSTRVLGVKPAATSLAVHPGEMAGESLLPVLAVAPAEDGRAAVFTGDTTRNWHQSLKTLDRETPFLRFWGQMVRWLAGRSETLEAEAGIVASTDKAHYEPGSPISITAVVRGSEGQAVSDARVVATVRGPATEPHEISLAPITGPAGNYQNVFEPEQSGPYTIAVVAHLEDTALEAEPLEVAVGRPNLEFEQLDLNEKLLSTLANETSGSYAHITTADRLIERLHRRSEKRRIQYELPLSWPPLLWTLFVCVLTAEWMLRRRYALR